MGSVLVNENPPVAADLIYVLGGDVGGGRILRGAELSREGYARTVLVGNGEQDYGYLESDLAIAFAARHGYDPSLFVAERGFANSTVDEARRVVPDFRRMGAHRILLVTTEWHSARAGRVFRRTAPDLEFYVVGVDDRDWHHGNWWIDREGRKRFVLEALRTIADFLRI